jgi:hypothetical protein
MGFRRLHAGQKAGKGLWMKRNLLGFLVGAALMLAMSLAAGCGGGGPGDAVGQFIDSLNSRDFGAFYDQLSKDSTLRAIPRDEFIKNAEGSQPQDVRIDEFKITSETFQDENNATVTWTGVERLPGHDDNQLNKKYSLVKEDGEWKVKSMGEN